MGWDRGCWVATDLVDWSLASRLPGVRQFREPYALGSVLLKCEVIRVLLNIGQKISRKQYVSIILTIHFNAGINEVMVCSSKCRHTNRHHDRFAVHWPSAEKTISCVCGCRWRTRWTQDATFINYDILCRHFKTQLFEILLFCSVNTGCFVEYNACYVLHFVTAIILRHTKNIYEICNYKPHRLKANFLADTVMYFSFKLINIWKSYCKNTKGSRFYESRCSFLFSPAS